MKARPKELVSLRGERCLRLKKLAEDTASRVGCGVGVQAAMAPPRGASRVGAAPAATLLRGEVLPGCCALWSWGGTLSRVRAGLPRPGPVRGADARHPRWGPAQHPVGREGWGHTLAWAGKSERVPRTVMGKRREDTKGSENKVQRPGGCRGLQANTPLGDFRELVWEWLLGILAVWKPLESSSFLQLPRKSALAKQLWGQLGLSVLSPSACR